MKAIIAQAGWLGPTAVDPVRIMMIGTNFGFLSSLPVFFFFRSPAQPWFHDAFFASKELFLGVFIIGVSCGGGRRGRET